jgi:integrase
MELKNKTISQKGIKRPGKDYVPPIEVNFFEQITTFDIANFIASQVRSKGLAPKTANRYREILTRLYNWAMDQYGVRMPENKNPAAKVERYKEKAQNIRFLSLEKIDEQLQALEGQPQLQVMVAMYIYAGLRREEALWLTVGDVDLDAGINGMIRVQAKTIDGEYWESKTQVNRVVPISNSLRKYLDQYEIPDSEQGWFFPSPKGVRWDVNNFSQALAKINKANDLPWTCLDYRHTFGSQLAMKGESLYKISTLMGNSPEICRRHYAALIPEALADCVNF